MSAAEVDGISRLWRTEACHLGGAAAERILNVIPDAEQGISYWSPGVQAARKVVAGFAAFKNHLSYLPRSGSVFPELRDELTSYRTSTGALQFPIDAPLSKHLVERLVAFASPRRSPSSRLAAVR